MAKIHLRHSRKGHFNPHHFGHHLKMDRTNAEAVVRSIWRPRACLYQADPVGDGIERNLDWERNNKITIPQQALEYPFPSIPEKGLYGRLLYNEDLEAIERLEQAISSGIANGFVSGLAAMSSYRRCETMRRLCKAMLLRTVSILQAKDRDSKSSVSSKAIITLNGIILTPLQQEHVRRLLSEPLYLKQQLSKLQEPQQNALYNPTAKG